MHEPARLPHPAPTTKRADTRPERAVREGVQMVNASARPEFAHGVAARVPDDGAPEVARVATQALEEER
jgi:hypothetical protein